MNRKQIILWILILLSIVTAFLLPALFGTVSTEANNVRKLNVAGFKGDRDPSEWRIPSDEGRVFAGWCSDQACTEPCYSTTGAAYAKFVD
ncbi:MAG: hypothetical protein IK088_06250, partial [Lachnospiraceae bacterium]|nr:hypothetical protein [Lachnospiraceae bacterium]